MLDITDGELIPSLESWQKIIRLVREWRANIVIGHRSWDYHPDHRKVGVLIQDAAFMVTVPYGCSDAPPLKKNPVFLYSNDGFKNPYPFQADIVGAVDDGFDLKVTAIHEMASQHYEGGAPGSAQHVKSVPLATDVAGRKAWLRERWTRRQGGEANLNRDLLIKW